MIVLTPAGLRAFGRRLPCSIGRGGVVADADKREGDGATPAGVLRVTGCLFRPDRMTRPVAWAQPIRPGDLWCDAPGDPRYNRLVRAPFGASHEVLRRADPMYDLVLVTDWNMSPAVPGRGSAIFLHRWRRPGAPTAGCIAMPAGDLLWLTQRIRPGTEIRVPEPSRA